MQKAEANTQGYECASVSQGYESWWVVIYFHAICANLFLNSILSSHYYLAVRH